jgi:hypothetical protein
MQTRSGFQILNQLGANVEVPPEHSAERCTYLPLISIQADKSQPADVFAAVKHRDYWYWIDDRDFRSKSIFTFLMNIMTLSEKENNIQVPVVTIQGN